MSPSEELVTLFMYLVTDTLPPQAVPLCPRHVWSCCVPGTWHIFPHPGPPWPKLVKKDGVHMLTILRLLQFSDDHPRIHGVYTNFLWRQLQCHTPGSSSDLRNAFLCSLAYLVIWSSAALEILYANTLQGRYMESKKKLIHPPGQQPISIHIWMSYPGKERIPLTLDTLTTFPSVFSRWGTASIVRCKTARTLVAITLGEVTRSHNEEI